MAKQGGIRPAGWRALWSAPGARPAFGGIVWCHTVMVALMAMAPATPEHGGTSLAIVGLVISLRIAGL